MYTMNPVNGNKEKSDKIKKESRLRKDCIKKHGK